MEKHSGHTKFQAFWLMVITNKWTGQAV